MKSAFEHIMDMGDKNELSEYVGYWIGVVDGKIVAKEKDAKTAYLKTKSQYPNKVPFVMKVPTEDVMLL
jgi:Family of unknown function (DUF5678)